MNKKDSTFLVVIAIILASIVFLSGIEAVQIKKTITNSEYLIDNQPYAYGEITKTINNIPISQNPVTVVITSPEDGAIVTDPHLVVLGYAVDEAGMNYWEWEWHYQGESHSNSSYFETAEYVEFRIDIYGLHPGWNLVIVRFKNIYGAWGEDSVNVTYNPPNNPPNKPATPEGPTSGKVGETLYYTTVTTDPDDDSLEYLIDWGDGTDTGWLGPVASGTPFENFHSWGEPGVYSIKAKARDLPYLSESEWSDPLTVTISKTGNESPVVTILGPLSESVFNEPDITVNGYITDDTGIISVGSIHEWEEGETQTSGTVDPPQTYYPFEWNFVLYPGWNKITIFAENENNRGENSTIVYYNGTYTNPNETEKNILKSKLKSFHTDVANKVKDITQAKESLGEEGEGKYIKVAEKKCKGKDLTCEIKIKTRFVHWDKKLVTGEKGKNAVGFAAIEGYNDKFDKEKKIKTLYVNFIIMIDSKWAGETDGNEVGKIDFERLFFHELLHIQLALDKWKNQNWEGWEKLCKCKKPSLKIGDPNHETISRLEPQFLDETAKSKGYTSIKAVEVVAAAGKNGEFDKTIKIPKEIAEKKKLKMKTFGRGVEGNIDLKVDEKNCTLTLKGKLCKGLEKGEIWVWIDPPNVGFITYAEVVIDDPPLTPSRPNGPTIGRIGKTYSYYTTTTDPDGDQLYYWFDWGDNTNSSWLGPYNSGETVTASHSWSEKGSYQIKVKAKDSKGVESNWSEPLSISIPKNKARLPNLLLKFLQETKLFPYIKILLFKIETLS